MLNRTVLGIGAIAIAICVIFLILRFGTSSSERATSQPAPTVLADTDLAVRPAGADAVAFVLATEAKVEVEVTAKGPVFDSYVMSEADWKAVKIPGGAPMFTMRNVRSSKAADKLPAGNWQVVVHDAHGQSGMTVHVRVVANPRPAPTN